LTGNASSNVLDGGSGNDLLIGGAGGDTLIGGNGIDTVSYATSAAGVNVNLTSVGLGGDAQADIYNTIENVIGSALADTLTGDANANVLEGGAGNDRLDGGVGNDTLIGGTGNDTFVFRSAFGRDTITDFTAGEDVLELHGHFLNANAALAAATQTGTDVTITIDATTSIILQNIALSNLHASDFHIV
jgi:Ca2+-binding RTX toxin-like protein